MSSIFAAVFFFALGVTVVLAGLQMFMFATTQATYPKLCACVLLAIACIAGGCTLAYLPWSLA